ncbi:uncharacterized protein C1orf232-like [Corythoichthys intestinalis]|uniref:uncharacterized protein C1orf232-like n=1 Tax=Corythoichthys intestinalis TaxID=161448 RepID=UPI0025A65CC6|nr:uncharacterized protein C1orf232-like [Corythoichthys intestinalis]XP_061789183.1 uncharacterized protein C1orf232-like [Nerophis lumbriciformis]
MNHTWRLYKSKVMKTLDPEYVDDSADEVSEVEEDMMSPVQQDESQNAVFQLARKMQGAGAKSWNRLSALFNKDDQHQLLQEPESPPVADHPLAVKPEVPPRPTKARSGFWDSFAANWAAKKQAEADAAAQKATEETEAGTVVTKEDDEEKASPGPSEEAETDGMEAAEEDERRESSNDGFSKYVTLGGQDASFKWNFVTSKLAELRRASPADTD